MKNYRFPVSLEIALVPAIILALFYSCESPSSTAVTPFPDQRLVGTWKEVGASGIPDELRFYDTTSGITVNGNMLYRHQVRLPGSSLLIWIGHYYKLKNDTLHTILVDYPMYVGHSPTLIGTWMSLDTSSTPVTFDSLQNDYIIIEKNSGITLMDGTGKQYYGIADSILFTISSLNYQDQHRRYVKVGG